MITEAQLALWAVTIIAACFAGWSSGWAIGFLRGVRWEKSNHQTWLGKERRKAEKPVPVERRAGRHAPADGPPATGPVVPPATFDQPATGEMAAPAPLPPVHQRPDPEPEDSGFQDGRAGTVGGM